MPAFPWYLAQRITALVLLILALPLLFALFVMMKLKSPGPFFFCQQRRGLHGKPFTIWKIRTMEVGANRCRENAFAVRLDHPQVTRLGRVLRDLKLDELPQLWNVVRGEMRFVGPRPIADALYDELRIAIPGFELRTQIRPGLTSLAQVTLLDNNIDFLKDWEQRFEAETHFIRRQSIAYDLVVIGLTFVFLVRKIIKRLINAVTSRTPHCGMICLLASLAACSTGETRGIDRAHRDQSPDYVSTPLENETLAYEENDGPSYILGPGDSLAINVFGEPGMSDLQVRIDGKGLIQLPLIDPIEVAGLTTEVVQKQLKARFNEHLKDPWVTVQVAQYRSKPIYLLGEFRDPGVFYLDRPTRVIQALAFGGGLGPQADLRSASVLRDGKVLTVDLYRLLRQGEIQQNIRLLPNDTVFVPDDREQFVFVLGKVEKPGPQRMIHGRLSLVEALASAGGPNLATSKLRKIHIIRPHSLTKGEHIQIDLRQTILGERLPFPLQRGDVVFVPRNELEKWNDFVRAITPTLQLVSSTLHPFVQVKFLAENS